MRFNGCRAGNGFDLGGNGLPSLPFTNLCRSNSSRSPLIVAIVAIVVVVTVAIVVAVAVAVDGDYGVMYSP